MNKKKTFSNQSVKTIPKKKLFTDEKRLCKRVRCVQALPCVDMLDTGTRHPLQGHAHVRLCGREREKERKGILFNVSKRVYRFTFTLTRWREELKKNRTEKEG